MKLSAAMIESGWLRFDLFSETGFLYKIVIFQLDTGFIHDDKLCAFARYIRRVTTMTNADLMKPIFETAPLCWPAIITNDAKGEFFWDFYESQNFAGVQPMKGVSLKIGDKIAARIVRSPATHMDKLTVTNDYYHPTAYYRNPKKYDAMDETKKAAIEEPGKEFVADVVRSVVMKESVVGDEIVDEEDMNGDEEWWKLDFILPQVSRRFILTIT